MELWQVLSIPVILFTAWFYTATVSRTRFPTLRNKAIVLLIAHPDDEAMFFAPTVLALTQPELGNHLKILCLSNGNADGLGTVREKEIKESGLLLGLRSKDDVLVLDDPTVFPDSMQQEWPSPAIVSLLDSHFLKSATGQSKRKDAKATSQDKGAPPRTTIDVLITFDKHGVSSHPNHRSLYHGAVAWVQSMVKGRPGWDSPVTLYTLQSVNLLRKYAGLLDMPWTLLWSLLGSIGSRQRDLPDRAMFLSDVSAYLTARSAMTKAHRSQMVWFRWAWITIGRYMYLNDLRRALVR